METGYSLPTTTLFMRSKERGVHPTTLRTGTVEGSGDVTTQDEQVPRLMGSYETCPNRGKGRGVPPKVFTQRFVRRLEVERDEDPLKLGSRPGGRESGSGGSMVEMGAAPYK